MAQKVDFAKLAGFFKKQVEALRAVLAHKYVLYGGARGPGKSYFLRWVGLYLLLMWAARGHKGVRVGLFCEDYPTLKDRQISKIELEFPAWLGETKTTQSDGLAFHLKPTFGGGKLCLRNLDKPAKYQSSEFAAVLVDELTKNRLTTFNILRGSMRWPGIADVKFVGATNPGDVGHLWVRDFWIDGNFPPEMEKIKHEFHFVPGLPDDNPHLPEGYWLMLESLPPALSRAWRWGDWDIWEGQFFSEWRKEKHVVEAYEIPDGWVRWRAVDWGYAAPFCCLWLARDPESGRTVVYREVYKKELTDPEQAELIAGMTDEEEKIRYTLADPSMWTKKTTERQTVSSADVYRRHGVRLTKADNDRIGGWRRVRESLKENGDGRPGLQVFRACTNLVRTLPALPYDEIRTEDIDTHAEDHAADALRYALSWKIIGKRRKPRSPKQDYWKAVRG